ncbi:Membrane protein insertase YidC [Candidatus Desulfarcum epimagneticum]|uniref:Membrane protein insertase YidC n=1 Tax=uncultured Desulfobacteraceae bacterium TaxID=218296 RepID=A0A484HD94_9BACT|nr:Membrane protein insertase YidC [uncultured Desulfobacteraceae bacterium]
MEQARLFIAIGISFTIFLIWATFFEPKMKEKAPEIQKTAQAEKNGQNAPAPYPEEKKAGEYDRPDPVQMNPAQTAPGDPAASPGRRARTIRVETPLYEAEISENGGALKRFALKEYREEAAPDSPYKELIPKDLPTGSPALDFPSPDGAPISGAVFDADIETDSMTVSGAEKAMTLTWRSPDGLAIEKRYVFRPGRYDIGLEIRIVNRTGEVLRKDMALSLLSRAAAKAATYGFEGPSALVDKSLEQIKVKEDEETQRFSGKIDFIAMESRYFMGSVIPQNAPDAEVRAFNRRGDLYCRLVYPGLAIGDGESRSFSFNVYYGPKRLGDLKSVSPELAHVVNFGWFDFIAKPCLWLMNFFYKHIPNYGIAIILLTLLTKLLLWPLGTKSYKSMGQMKKMQPLMAELREKYKHDKKRMNEEVMSLYKTYKVNPLGGCLPMVAQIPVFFALYRMLYQAIELRHAPFLLWINDLSAPDRLFSFPFSIPLMEPPYGVPVLTLIMGGTMFLQQKMSPPMGNDPKQAKMMMTLMPIVFTVIFINFSSGLVLYWLINNVLSIAQQYYVTQKHVA